MRTEHTVKHDITNALRACVSGSLAARAESLLNVLGYRSEKRFDLSPNTFGEFVTQFDRHNRLNPQRALSDEWKSVDLLFQLTDDELRNAGQARFVFEGGGQVDNTIIHSYLFFAIDLRGDRYTRTQLSGITREVNRVFDMPAMILFRHGQTLTLSIINRRLHKRDESKDVLEKVTLIKDIATTSPHRAHVEILFDLSLERLHERLGFTNFVQLHNAWQKTLDTSELNKRFFGEIANWYFWAQQHVKFPKGAGRNEEERNATSLIRLLTRLIFVWFIKEKGLVPDALFDQRSLAQILIGFTPQSGADNPVCATRQAGLSASLHSAFYKAILQNLFFATLNQEMNTPQKPDNRKFRGKTKQAGGRDQHYMIHNVYRYRDCFKDPDEFLRLCSTVPFLNGGLFECLDKEDKDNPGKVIRVDGFSDRPDNETVVPDFLFFSDEQDVNLNAAYGTTNKRYKVRGLIDILHRYKFTVAENTPIEEEIALDPELLGKVFENLLAAYNPETRVTARKQTGSYYTPREIVDYMVDESLVAYLETALKQAGLPVSQNVTQAILPATPSASVPFQPLDPQAEVHRTRRRLPHWVQPGRTYFITFRLADSLPQEKLRQWVEERDIWLKSHPKPWSERDEAEYQKRFGDRIEEWLDQGYGSCVLRRPEARALVERCLRHFDGQRYNLGDFVIMPNHVHLLITPHGGFELSDIMKGIKGVSAHDCNRLLGEKGKFWMDESFDHIVRNADQLENYRHYIADNPSKAGLSSGSFTYYQRPEDVTQAILPVREEQTGLATSPDVTQAILPVQQGQTGLATSPDVTQAILPVQQGQTGLATSPDVTQAILPVQQGQTEGQTGEQTGLSASLESRLRHLLAYNEEPHQFTDAEVECLIEAIDAVKILDPACGSGAFPMGVLHKLVFILGKLDPGNQRWKQKQIDKAREIPDITVREKVISDIEQAFTGNELDYGRKLFLIENCIYGVDIQPIAVQIAKLRCFISLIVDQKMDDAKPNRGVIPLPNLETKFVAANSLIGIEKPAQQTLRNPAIDQKEKELADVRRNLFTARTPATKNKYRDLDKQLRDEVSDLLRQDGFPVETTQKLARWDPYDQNASAEFFDAEWMFGLRDGFDIVIGNPPYISALDFSRIYGDDMRNTLNSHYHAAKGAYDIYVLFVEKGLDVIGAHGHLSYITPNKYLSAKYAAALREHILNTGSVWHLVDVSCVRVFEEAAVYPILTFISKKKCHDTPVRVLLPRSRQVVQFEPTDFHTTHVEREMMCLLPEKLWGFMLSEQIELLRKVIADTEPLEGYFGSVNATTTAAEADEFGALITDIPKSGCVKVVNTGTIDRYVSLWGVRQMTHGGRGFLKPYLSLQQTSISRRRRDMYSSPKIVFAKMAKRCEAFIDINGEYASLNTNCFYNPRPGVSLEFIGAFCNSTLFMFIYEQFFGALRMSGGYFQFQAPQLRVIPLKPLTKEEQAPFVAIVDRILTAKRADPDADTTALEREIDQLVYRLYDLTAEEIAVVEGKSGG